MFTWDYNYFPSLYGGEYIYDDISVNPFTFEPEHAGCRSRRCARGHTMCPDTTCRISAIPYRIRIANDYAAFLQDTVRLNGRVALSLGVRYDLQTFTSKDLVNNPLVAGFREDAFGSKQFLAARGSCLFDRRSAAAGVPWRIWDFLYAVTQIYESSVINNDGLTGTFLFLDNADTTDHRIFPSYPNVMVTCSRGPVACAPPDSLKPYLTSDVSAFAPNCITPKVQQGSFSVEREIADRFAVGVSYLYVHGENLIRRGM